MMMWDVHDCVHSIYRLFYFCMATNASFKTVNTADPTRRCSSAVVLGVSCE